MNTLRVSNGFPALIEDPIINAVAQSTAATMAASQMSSHIGNVRGRLQAAGYGGGAQVWATENFAVGNMSIDEIMIVWSDAAHMLPAVNPAYCHVGAGTAKSANGQTYYILQAAYMSGQACGEYKSPGGAPGGFNPGVPQIIVPVKVAEPDQDGKVFHTVEAGQSFWAIAIAYKITIKDLETWNNISRDIKLQIGQKLFIPTSNTEGYATPTPVGMVQIATPGPDGNLIHTVQAYQTLSTIAQAYKTDVDTLLAQNGLQVDWPLQIGQKLYISAGSSSGSGLTAIDKLTPESDGNYYHTIKSGETLSWIAKQYGVSLWELMAWNGLNESSIIQPAQKLILMVTPPATNTPAPQPVVATHEPHEPTSTPTPSFTPSPMPSTPTASKIKEAGASPPENSILVFFAAGLAVSVLLLAYAAAQKKK